MRSEPVPTPGADECRPEVRACSPDAELLAFVEGLQRKLRRGGVGAARAHDRAQAARGTFEIRLPRVDFSTGRAGLRSAWSAEDTS